MMTAVFATCSASMISKLDTTNITLTSNKNLNGLKLTQITSNFVVFLTFRLRAIAILSSPSNWDNCQVTKV